ncbi:MAG TPA: TMEM14 family protein [Candidatus Omnitrophota bacterium]|nr:TMEM14 family protein [Candidatus Omnitrophota bacterium]
MNLATLTNIYLLFYGIMLLTGAYFGIKAGSKISLIMGLVSGAIVLLALWLSKQSPVTGYAIIAIVGALLTAVFLIRLLKTGAFMPAGMLLTLSVIALIVSLLRLKG